MKSYLRKGLALVLACLALLPLAATAFAAEETGTDRVKVIVSVKNGPKIADTYRFTLTPDSETCPMPGGVKSYSLYITGEGEKPLPKITFPSVGIYSYTIRQEKGKNAKCRYDTKTVYTLTVYVTNGKDGRTVTTTVTPTEHPEDKRDHAAFENVYEKAPRPDTPKTNDESNVPLYMTMAVASTLVLVGLYLTRRKEEED